MTIASLILSILSVILAIGSIVLSIYLQKRSDIAKKIEKEQLAKLKDENKTRIVASKDIAFSKEKGLFTLKLQNESQTVGVSDLQIKMRIINIDTKNSYSLKEINILGGLRSRNEAKTIEDSEVLIRINVMTINKKSILRYRNKNILNLYENNRLRLSHILKNKNVLAILVNAINEKTRISESVVIQYYNFSNVKHGHFNKGEMDVKEENIPFNK